MINLIEQMHLLHFKYLPEKLGFFVKEIENLHIINCGLGSSMFNIVFGGIAEPNEQIISSITKEFKGQPFAWWIPPSQKNQKLTVLLHDCGFIKEANEKAMLCDLRKRKTFPLQTNLIVQQVQSQIQLKYFVDILREYDETVGDFYCQLKNDFNELSEKFFVGFIRDLPAVISILYSNNEASSIFTLITKEGMRNSGYGSDMMRYLLNFAKEKIRSRHVTLSASNDEGHRIYERLGFENFSEFECFEYKGI